jgi:hypothetical protein
VFGTMNGMDRLTETWETARVAMAPRLAAARDAVGPLVDEASVRVAPIIDKVGPAVDTARTRLRSDVVPAVAAAVENSAPARAEARERAEAALLALRGQQRKVRRWPIALGCLLAGAAAGMAAGALNRRLSTPVTPTPFPAPAPTATATQEDAADSTAPYPAGHGGRSSG